MVDGKRVQGTWYMGTWYRVHCTWVHGTGYMGTWYMGTEFIKVGTSVGVREAVLVSNSGQLGFNFRCLPFL